MLPEGSLLFLLFLFVVLGIVIIAKGVMIIQQQESVIIERLGSYHKTLGSGLNIIVPIIDSPRKMWWIVNGVFRYTDRIDCRETIIDIPEQRVITKDNAGITIDALIYLQITDVRRAAYEVQTLPLAIQQLTQTNLRSLIGEMELDHTLSSRDQINSRLKEALDEATNKWGVKISRVEIRNINPPNDIQQAMEKQMQAERERRAQVLAAEGSKQSKVLEAEGERQARIARSEGEQQEKINQARGDREATISRAEGQAQAIEAVAVAQAKAIECVRHAFGSADVAANYLVAMEYLKRFGDMTQKSTDKVFIPYEASGVLSSLGGIKEMLGKGVPPAK
jgi:regulator of protease activity HflC (stomatin/prohibitin superfamily)